MATSDIAKLTKLPELPKPPLKKWQQLPSRSKTGEKSPSKTPHRGHCTKTPKSTKAPKSTSKTPSGCRFIPSRSGINDDYGSYLLLKKEPPIDGHQKDSNDEEDNDPSDDHTSTIKNEPDEEFKTALLSSMCDGDVPRGVLSFRTPSNQHQRGSFLNYTANNSLGSASFSRSLLKDSQKRKERRKLPTAPEKILDAPSLTNDYYLNTVDWGRNNILAVALGSAVYLWNAGESVVSELVQLSSDELYVSSVSWADTGKYLAVGISNGDIQLWDVIKEKKVRTMRGHEDRVSSLHWNSYTLASGSRSGEIHIHDVRKPEHCIAQLRHHTMEVCGLQWSSNGCYLASGGNDNVVCIWRPGVSEDVSMVLSGHSAAIKALSWCPRQQNLLATGGGTTDQTVKFWNVTTGECTQSLNTKSQVSGIKWSKQGNELISSHGGPRNQLAIWSYPSLNKVAELKGHSDRVLSMSVSPHRTRVISAGADETLRIWRCFEPDKSALADKENASSVHSTLGGMYY